MCFLDLLCLLFFDWVMNSTLATNFLLLVISFLLLIQVIQSGMYSNASGSNAVASRSVSSYGSYGSASVNPHQNPTVRDDAPMMAHAMYSQALRGFPDGCNREAPLAECNSPAAEAVKSQINEWANQGLGPRQVFDKIIETYGVDSLTAQARQIREARIQSQNP